MGCATSVPRFQRRVSKLLRSKQEHHRPRMTQERPDQLVEIKRPKKISSEIEPDESVSDEGYAESTSMSYNGRIYAAYGKHKPWMPVDDAEMDRNDFQHCKFTLLRKNELHLAPIKRDPYKILDLDTSCTHLLLPNVQFEIDDVLCPLSSDDGTHIPSSAFEEMAQICFDMGDRIGASGKAPFSRKTQLEEAGSENVVEKGPRMKKIGAFELTHFRDGIRGDPLYFEILLARAKAEVSNRRMHTYLLFYVVYSQRPLETQV
ncbi:uncharacterized protein LY89DRAFT_698075 [Mollisia scopiformis]|uniref:Uncharacterized protein n=1 Tax=Mollisia scopiformis TaxID=149040 RepID=A0A194X4S8_MOLSC|nr:uncharacterized protein LY89DRAFT_698075 [Mollisia scopiformis]KUJ15181.1 hypothetical protein LY89DRAFT_698075 [Mollisia scopiformis]